jgi:hypothetical protein
MKTYTATEFEIEFYRAMHEFGEYRWKPAPKRTVIIDGVELVAPETAAPKGEYFFISVAMVESKRWGDYEYEKRWLRNGLIFLTHEDAMAMYEAQRKQRLGGAA